MTTPRPISVRGGSDGIEAHCEDLLRLAHQYAGAARDTGEQVLRLHAHLVHPAVLAAAGVDPIGAADFAAVLTLALDGPDGLSWRAVECTTLGTGLRFAAATYEGADVLRQQVVPTFEAGLDVPGAVAVALPALLHGDSGAALQDFVTADPELVDGAVDLITGFWSDHLLIDTVARYPDGRPRVSSAGTDSKAGRPPHSLRDVMADLSHRNDGPGGEIGISFVTGPDGVRRVIVDIPGTKSWNVLPGQSDVTGSGTNVRALAGATTTYEAGVLEAMRAAGVTSSDTVLMVGHSQGGMVAVNAAAVAARTGEFNVTHVVTAGSPIGRLPVPRTVQVLALENDGDVVPHCDGAGNPDRTNVTTVTIERNHHRVLDNHALPESYVPGAADVDASGNQSTRDYLDSLKPYLDGQRMTTQVYEIKRV